MADREHAERVARVRQAAKRAEGPWRAKRVLADALRELLEQLPATAAPAEQLETLVPVIRDAAHRFAAAGRAPAASQPASLYAGMENFQDTGPIVGLSNPVAPPLEFTVDPVAQVARGTGRFGAAYEGAPGLLHGGILAAAFDELLGVATVFSGGPGMTRELTVRYLRPTPIGVELSFTARLERAEGRRLFVSAEVEASGVRTAEASGVFTAVGGEKFEAFARARRERERR
jgi:acyl-coenzyme A thioesterase PaaI-like protein